jgi:hypothetical protein
MRCPRCRAENPDGTNYCQNCGTPQPKDSPAKKFFIAALRGVLYVALFFAVQIFVSFVFLLTDAFLITLTPCCRELYHIRIRMTFRHLSDTSHVKRACIRP